MADNSPTVSTLGSMRKEPSVPTGRLARAGLGNTVLTRLTTAAKRGMLGRLCMTWRLGSCALGGILLVARRAASLRPGGGDHEQWLRSRTRYLAQRRSERRGRKVLGR